MALKNIYTDVLYVRGDDGKFIPIPYLTGKDGKSAYEYAVEAGYEGSEEQFTSDLYTSINNENGIVINLTPIDGEEDKYHGDKSYQDAIYYIGLGKPTAIKVGDIIIPVSYTDVTGDVVFECIDAENNRYLKYTLDNESVYTKSYTKIAVSEEEVQAMIDGAFEEEIDFIDYTIDP